VRIVFVVHTFFPNWTAGTEVYTKSLARTLVKQGHEVFIVCYEPPTESYPHNSPIQAWDSLYEGLPVHRISFHRVHHVFHIKDYFHRQVEEHLKRYFEDIRPDVVHVVHAMHLTTASIWAAKEVDLPVVSTATDFWYICPTYQLVKWDDSLCHGPVPLTCLGCMAGGAGVSWLRKLAGRQQLIPGLSPVLLWLARFPVFRSEWQASLLWLSERRAWMEKTLLEVDVLVVPTANTARLVTVNGLRAASIRNSGFGLEMGFVSFEPTHRPASVLRLGYVGTFRHSKGLHILLDAMRLLPVDQVHLDIYGKSGHFPEYDRSLGLLAKGLDHIAFRGTFPNDKLPEVFNGFDILVIPSLWYENSPLVLLSAFAQRIPVIASNIGSLADLVDHGQSGLLFETGDPNDLAKQIEKLLKDPQLLGRLRAGIPPVKTVEDNVDELLEIYAKLREDFLRHPREPVTRPPALNRVHLWGGSLYKTLKTIAWGAQFGPHLTLLRCKVAVMEGRLMAFDLQWYSAEVPSDWMVFIHLLDDRGHIQLQGDHPLVQHDQDPWGLITYRCTILPDRVHSGKRYRVRIGVWSSETKVRLPVLRSRGMTIELPEQAVSLGDALIP
jgi:glycosyltransferase involved in cell wall biosynthesis